ncbi:MAG: SDR family oxidoreductase [Mesorhizobium sp.]|nr:SDR family NAD(P)-dependent oxidoreductase [Mesorhizobium sp.]MCO5160202.1 SDR family oxidoreductase [Mesorhizobium sp.]
MGELTGKTALVTGASKGIGRAIAARLAAEGCDVALVARDLERLTAAAEEIAERHGVRTLPIAADLSSESGCISAARTALDAFGGLDILVNCAGDTRAGTFPAQPDTEWTSGFALKFFGAVRLTRALWEPLKARRGTVINIGGAAAYTPSPGFMVGGAVNAALAHFSKSLSKQGLVDDVNVNIIHPGSVVTDRMDALIRQEAASTGISEDEVRRRNRERAGIRRLGEPDDIAETVVFLCLPRARHIQGVGIAVDGGATPGL